MKNRILGVFKKSEQFSKESDDYRKQLLDEAERADHLLSETRELRDDVADLRREVAVEHHRKISKGPGIR